MGLRIPILYLAPWVDIGGSDKGTIDWFRFLDRDRFRASLVTTQPSPNRRLNEITPYAEEVWDLPDLMPGDEFARFLLGFIQSRKVKIVHIMNARLGFELLPDIAHLPDPPRIVVQLHVEELDHSGYVRYVTTRYGNLVDAFSVSSQALTDALDAYEVPVAKRRLIRTGVDAEREFSPDRIATVGRPGSAACQILYPVRLTAQKNPLLMVQVAARLRARGVAFQIHVLGDGELAPELRDRIRVAGLHDHVILHEPSVNMVQWYAACDVVLLTSRFEGVPYVAYEAMAMATPIVTSDLPGVRELVTPAAGVLINPREDPDAYASAIAELAADPQRRRELGAAGRARARSEFPLQRMAGEHATLYEELLAEGPRLAATAAPPSVHSPGPSTPPPSPALRRRRPGARPLVSVIVPCHNHGRYLKDCLQSIARQDYSRTETILVDDGSTDPETITELAQAAGDDSVTLLRQRANRGPSVARNLGVSHARGRYILPLDADNQLLPGAITALVEQLGSAGERIGFVYPNLRFFGNRTDYFEPPSYNLQALLSSNFCDSSSLIDREVFDQGFRYPEDIRLGHEDWDFALSLAEAGIYGEPARAKTLLYRKHGFSRSDLVDTASVPFGNVVASRHPNLFAGGPALKAQWSPAVSLISLDPLAGESDDALGNLERTAARQTCQDFELILHTAAELRPTQLGARLRRISSAVAVSRAQALASGLHIARGRYALAFYGSPAAILADPAQLEKLLRVLRCNPLLDALAVAQATSELTPSRLLGTDDISGAELAAVLWAVTGPGAPPHSLELPGARPLEALASWLNTNVGVQWRHAGRRDHHPFATMSEGGPARIGEPRYGRKRDARLRAECPPALPDLPRGVAERIRRPGVWMPPQARILCRHLHHPSGRYLITNSPASPPECSLHFYLGSVRGVPLPGTTSLLLAPEGARGVTLGGKVDLDAPELLGFVEQAPLPLFDELLLARDRVTGQRVLVAGADDPLAASIEDRELVGYIEPYPIHPRRPPHEDVVYGLTGFVRVLDLRARRHRYAAGRIPDGRLAGELGALLTMPVGDCEPLWIGEDGRVLTAAGPHVNGRPPLGSAARWTGAPLTWHGLGTPGPRMRASLRRAYDSLRMIAVKPTPPLRTGEPCGYLLRSPTARTVALYAATHAVTGDQLLSTNPAEADSLGYSNLTLLGHLVAQAPVTGTLGVAQLGVPWASRFGMAVQSG